MNENGWVFSSRHRRFEYLVDGQVVAVDVLPGGSTEGLPEDVATMTTPANIRAAATRFAQGDEAAGDELDSLLAEQNDPYQTDVQAATDQTGTQAQQGQQGQGGMLPSADFINAQVDVFTIAANIVDAGEKLRQREEAVARKYQGYGRPMPDLKSGGEAGPFPATPGAISALAGSNPDYIRAFGGIQNLAAAVEINRHQNALAAADTEITNYADWDDAVAEYETLFAQREQAAVDMDQEAAAELAGVKTEDYARVQQAGWRSKAATLAALDAKLAALSRRFNRHPEAGTWSAERNLQQARSGTLKAGSVHRDTIGREIPNEWLPYEQQQKPVRAPGEPDPGPPAWTRNVPPGAAPDLSVFGTPEQHGQTAAPPAPSYTAPPKPAPAAAPAQALTAPMPKSEQPPRAAGPGMRWEKRGDTWVEVPDEAGQPNAAPALPAFAEGGVKGWGWTQNATARGGVEAGRPAQAGQRVSGFTGVAPPVPTRGGVALAKHEVDQQMLELERTQIDQQYQQAVVHLMAMHRERMAPYSAAATLTLATPQPVTLQPPMPRQAA